MSTFTTAKPTTGPHTTSRTTTQPTNTPTRTLRRPQAPHYDGGLSARRPARSGRAERRARGCHCGRQDRGSTPVGLRSVPVGGSGGGVFEVGSGQWWAGAQGGEGAGWSPLRQTRNSDLPLVECARPPVDGYGLAP